MLEFRHAIGKIFVITSVLSLMWSECGTKSALQNLCTGITVFISVYACKLMWWRKSLCRSKESLGTTKVVIDFTAIWWPRSTKTASMLENYFYEKSCGINSGMHNLTTPTKSNYQRSKFIRHNSCCRLTYFDIFWVHHWSQSTMKVQITNSLPEHPIHPQLFPIF